MYACTCSRTNTHTYAHSPGRGREKDRACTKHTETSYTEGLKSVLPLEGWGYFKYFWWPSSPHFRVVRLNRGKRTDSSHPLATHVFGGTG